MKLIGKQIFIYVLIIFGFAEHVVAQDDVRLTDKEACKRICFAGH